MGFDVKQQSEIDVEEAESVRILKIDHAIITDIKSQVKERMEQMARILQ